MKFSNLPYGYIDKVVRKEGLSGIVEWVEFCNRVGLDGVEISSNWLKHLVWIDVVYLISLLKRLPIEVSMFTIHNRMCQTTPQGREAAVANMIRHMDMATEFNANLIRTESGGWDHSYGMYNMSRADAIDATVATFEECIHEAESRGVTLLLENHPGWLGRFADVFNELLERLPSEAIGANLDTGSIYREGQRPDDFLKHANIVNRTKCLHVKCAKFIPDAKVGYWDQSVSFYESDIDNAEIFKCLKKAGFDGWISYEAYDGISLKEIGEQIARLREMWENA